MAGGRLAFSFWSARLTQGEAGAAGIAGGFDHNGSIAHHLTKVCAIATGDAIADEQHLLVIVRRGQRRGANANTNTQLRQQ